MIVPDSANRLHRSRGFTLLELIIVLAIMSLVVGLVAGGIGRSAHARQRRQTMTALVAQLSLARIHAMERGRHVEVRISVGEDELWFRRDEEKELFWPLPETIMLDDQNVTIETRQVMYDADGRTAQRTWHFARSGTERTIWLVEFDPVSGAPRLVRADA